MVLSILSLAWYPLKAVEAVDTVDDAEKVRGAGSPNGGKFSSVRAGLAGRWTGVPGFDMVSGTRESSVKFLQNLSDSYSKFSRSICFTVAERSRFGLNPL